MLPAFLGMAALDYMKQQTANREKKKQAQAGILQSSAASMGAPTYNVQAARTLRDSRHANRELAGEAASNALSSYLGGMGGGAGDTAGQPDALAQDYQNNPAAPGSGYAGASLMPPKRPDDEQGY